MKDFKFKYYSDGKTKVIAVSHYAGHTIRGVAYCSPEDKFDLHKGMALAKQRCKIKLLSKRSKRAKNKEKEIKKILDKNMLDYQKAEKYAQNSYKEWEKAVTDYTNLIENMGH